MMRTYADVRRGMTLIELMVAIVITGMALAAGYAALSTVIDRSAKTDLVMTDVARAAAVRRTIFDWIEHGQLKFTSGVPGQTSNFSLGQDPTNSELQFVTTAHTPLHTDSTSVHLYVGSYTDGMPNSVPVQGLLAALTPSASAIQAIQSAQGSPSGQGFSGAGQLGGNSSSSTSPDGSYPPIIVPLDSTVTGMTVQLLIEQAGRQQWVSPDALTGQRGGQIILRAVRLIMQSANSPVLQAPLLQLPIVVPMQATL